MKSIMGSVVGAAIIVGVLAVAGAQGPKDATFVDSKKADFKEVVPGVKKVVLDCVQKALGKGCAPGALGVCMGGDRAFSLLMAKKQHFRPLHDKNPDPAKRSQPIIGLVIMENAKKSGANKWAGTLYNRENGKSYSGSITVKSKDAVDLSGCVALVLCRAVTWTRIK